MSRKEGVVAPRALVAVLAWQWWNQSRAIEMLPYGGVEQQLREGRFSEVTVGDTVITARRKEPGPDGRQVERVHDSSWLGTLLSWVAPVLIMLVGWNLMARGSGSGLGGGLLGIGRIVAGFEKRHRAGSWRRTNPAGAPRAAGPLRHRAAGVRDAGGGGTANPGAGASSGRDSRTAQPAPARPAPETA